MAVKDLGYQYWHEDSVFEVAGSDVAHYHDGPKVRERGDSYVHPSTTADLDRVPAEVLFAEVVDQTMNNGHVHVVSDQNSGDHSDRTCRQEL